jgi:hypothetical protein
VVYVPAQQAALRLIDLLSGKNRAIANARESVRIDKAAAGERARAQEAQASAAERARP